MKELAQKLFAEMKSYLDATPKDGYHATYLDSHIRFIAGKSEEFRKEWKECLALNKKASKK